jgi:hypothetical protein
MTLAQIKSMFIVGSKWRATRRDTLRQTATEESRSVEKAGSKDIVFLRQGSPRIWTQWPRAKEVLEARPGYLHFQYDNGVDVTLELVA